MKSSAREEETEEGKGWKSSLMHFPEAERKALI
jgi:hypothetical protein